MEASEDGSILTGKVLGDIVDGQRKMELLDRIAEKEGIALEQVCLYCGANFRRSQLETEPTIFSCCNALHSG
jgi:hypothetical protein